MCGTNICMVWPVQENLQQHVQDSLPLRVASAHKAAKRLYFTLLQEWQETPSALGEDSQDG